MVGTDRGRAWPAAAVKFSLRRPRAADGRLWLSGRRRGGLADISSTSVSSVLLSSFVLLYIPLAFRPLFSTTTSLLLLSLRLRGALYSDTTLSIPHITRIPPCLPNIRSALTARCSLYYTRIYPHTLQSIGNGNLHDIFHLSSSPATRSFARQLP